MRAIRVAKRFVRASISRAAVLVGIAAALMSGGVAHATTVKHFDLGQLTASAARVFRGTVVGVRPGTVFVGGGRLPTTTYRLRVIESFKGDFRVAKRIEYAEVTMLGSLKAEVSRGGLEHFSVFPDMPHLQRGQDYLLFLTAESRVALSSPVGMLQGTFHIDTEAPSHPTANGLRNAGLAADLKGPVPYDDLAARIRTIVASQKGAR